jgi:hypothetical protein
MTEPSAVAGQSASPKSCPGAAHRADEIRDVDLEQDDVPQYEEEAEQRDEIRREPHGQEFDEAIPLCYVSVAPRCGSSGGGRT